MVTTGRVVGVIGELIVLWSSYKEISPELIGWRLVQLQIFLSPYALALVGVTRNGRRIRHAVPNFRCDPVFLLPVNASSIVEVTRNARYYLHRHRCSQFLLTDPPSMICFYWRFHRLVEYILYSSTRFALKDHHFKSASSVWAFSVPNA